MDYSEMTTPQLQTECKRRGLPSGRAKAELVERLEAADAAEADPNDTQADVEMAVEPEPERVINEAWPQPERTDPKPGQPASPIAAPGTDPSVAPLRAFRQTFPAAAEGPTDDEHAAFRAQTRQAAIDAGLTPRGDAHRVGTVDGHEVYEVSVRQAT
ncbi:SAP domain-containing protein [Streptomyces turgidiscabies]|uniref:SAP domain-containing protein n=1 Tax=Streptomyces turgidiscabies TaxID=85558 RepID=UPI0038F71ADB